VEGTYLWLSAAEGATQRGWAGRVEGRGPRASLAEEGQQRPQDGGLEEAGALRSTTTGRGEPGKNGAEGKYCEPLTSQRMYGEVNYGVNRS